MSAGVTGDCQRTDYPATTSVYSTTLYSTRHAPGSHPNTNYAKVVILRKQFFLHYSLLQFAATILRAEIDELEDEFVL